jgi:hypothetical protein
MEGDPEYENQDGSTFWLETWSWKITEIVTDERYIGCKGDL